MAVKLKEIDRELTMVEGAISCGLMRQRAAELRQQNYPNYAVTPWRCQCITLHMNNNGFEYELNQSDR